MRTKVQRWGHSLAVRIPRAFAAETNVNDGTEVDVAVTNGKIVVAPIRKSAPRLADLLSRVTKRNIHGEIDTGGPIGRETW